MLVRIIKSKIEKEKEKKKLIPILKKKEIDKQKEIYSKKKIKIKNSILLVSSYKK